MTVFSVRFAATALALSLPLGACASRSTPAPASTIADAMDQAAQVYADEAAARQALATRWREGDQMLSAAERQRRDADKAITKSQRDPKRLERDIKRQQDRLAKAQKALTYATASRDAAVQKIAEGRALKADAEAQFRAAYPNEELFD